MANAAPKLLIVGSINRDLIFYGPHGSQMKPNACLVFDSWAAYHGGKGANQAAAAALLGARPPWWALWEATLPARRLPPP
mgnify:CR=1 FL=1